MTGLMDVEVPDNWEEGNPHVCPFAKKVQHAHGAPNTYDCYAEITFIGKAYDCNRFNCPIVIPLGDKED